jgi:Pyruvate/2-oxoacid:ferredoxin oxidoreductase gamma subunit
LSEDERDYVLSLQQQLAEKRFESAFKEAKLLEAESKIASSEKKIRAYEKALMNEKWVVKKYNLERFFSKSDDAGKANKELTHNTIKARRSTPLTSSSKKRPGRKQGSMNFGRDSLSFFSF